MVTACVMLVGAPVQLLNLTVWPVTDFVDAVTFVPAIVIVLLLTLTAEPWLTVKDVVLTEP